MNKSKTIDQIKQPELSAVFICAACNPSINDRLLKVLADLKIVGGNKDEYYSSLFYKVLSDRGVETSFNHAKKGVNCLVGKDVKELFMLAMKSESPRDDVLETASTFNDKDVSAYAKERLKFVKS